MANIILIIVYFIVISIYLSSDLSSGLSSNNNNNNNNNDYAKKSSLGIGLMNRLFSNENDDANDNANENLYRRELLSDPMTAAIFATSVNMLATFTNSNNCDFFDRGVCENVNIQINNHFCKISLRYIGRKYFGKVKVASSSAITPGQGLSGGEYYGSRESKGLVRYSINLPYTNGYYYLYYIDIFWCVDCGLMYDIPYTDDGYSPDTNQFGMAILPAYISDPASVEDSYKCLYATFYNSNDVTQEEKEDGISLVGAPNVPEWCKGGTRYYESIGIYKPGGNSKRTLGYNDEAVGLWLQAEMTEHDDYRAVVVDVFPYKGWGTKRQTDGKCPN